jgi:hypothetical protein
MIEKKQFKRKTFKFLLEVDAIPYNSETYHLIGPCFMEDFPEDVYAKELIASIRKDVIMSAVNKGKGNNPDAFREMSERLEEIELIKVYPIGKRDENYCPER